MMIQPIISLLLLGILIFTLAQPQNSRMVRPLMIVSIFFGILMTWMPELSQLIANYLGVGRGVDLLFYIWILVSLLALVALHFNIIEQKKQITELTRTLAIHMTESNSRAK